MDSVLIPKLKNWVLKSIERQSCPAVAISVLCLDPDGGDNYQSISEHGSLQQHSHMPALWALSQSLQISTAHSLSPVLAEITNSILFGWLLRIFHVFSRCVPGPSNHGVVFPPRQSYLFPRSPDAPSSTRPGPYITSMCT